MKALGCGLLAAVVALAQAIRRRIVQSGRQLFRRTGNTSEVPYLIFSNSILCSLSYDILFFQIREDIEMRLRGIENPANVTGIENENLALSDAEMLVREENRIEAQLDEIHDRMVGGRDPDQSVNVIQHGIYSVLH